MNALKILILLVVITFTANAQWVDQTSGTNNNLWDVSFVSQDIGFVCGDTGTILKTIDGGTNWVPMTSGSDYNLNGLQFVDQNNGYCASWFVEGGIMLKTLDGGSTWNDISLNIPETHSGGFWFFSADTGFLALGTSGEFSESKILKTVNGGSSWDTVYDGGTGWISFFHFPDRDNGYATVSGSKVLKTIDGGNNWTLLNNLTGDLHMSGVYFFDSNEGFVGGGNYQTGDGSIFKTNDGGASWEQMAGNFGTSRMLFTTPEIGYAIGSNSTTWDEKKIITTTDAGASWTLDATTSISMNGITFPTSNLGYAVGNEGKILKKTSGGVDIAINKAEERVSIYPNPAAGIVTLNINNLQKEKMYLNIYDIKGKLVRSETLIQNQQKFNVEKLSNGIYLLEIKSKEWSESQKLIIKK